MIRLLRSSIDMLPLRIRTHIRHIPCVSAIQRWLVNRVLSRQPFVHTINAGPARGLRFEVTLPLDKAVWSGTYELAFAEALRRGINCGDVCYDIGGYRGYMTGVMALAGASRVVVCEPFPGNIAALQRLKALNPRFVIALKKVAIGESAGHTAFKVMADYSMGKLADSPFQRGAVCVKDITVQQVRLDTMVFERGWPRPALIKVDVEGAEASVLRGAERILAEIRPLVYVEGHSGGLAEECSRLLHDAGYRVGHLEPENIAPELPRHLLAEPA